MGIAIKTSGTAVPITYPMRAVAKIATSRRRNMLDLLPREPQRYPISQLGHTRRGVYLISDPALVREIMVKRPNDFPKNDLFNAALEPLIGNGVFIADGEKWRHQRSHLEAAIKHLRTPVARQHIEDAARDGFHGGGHMSDLAATFSHVTADVMHRLLFGAPMEHASGQTLQSDFSQFQQHVGTLRLKTILFQRAFTNVRQPELASDVARKIRGYLLGQMKKALSEQQKIPSLTHLIHSHAPFNDPDMRDAWTLDQVAVFFLAGHETTASTLTWAAIQIAQNNAWRDEWCANEDGFRISLIKETMRMFPSGVFLPRVAANDTDLGGYTIKRGAMLLISPWTLHRHPRLWDSPLHFDPSRFLKGAPSVTAGSYLPFGMGARTCIGGAFSFLEADIILSHILDAFHLSIPEANQIKPFAGLTLGADRPVAADLQIRQ